VPGMAWHSSMNGHQGRGENHVYSRSAVVFRENEFRTPSPLLPSWDHSRPFNTAAMDEDSNDDCYFHSSDNVTDSSCLSQPDVEPVNFQLDSNSLTRSQFVAVDASDNSQLRCRNAELVDSYERRYMTADRTIIERTCTGSKLLNSRRPVIGKRSKSGLCYFMPIFYCLFFCCC